MYAIIRSFFFLLPAEKAHYATMGLFKIACSIPLVNSIIKGLFSFESHSLERKAFGLTFKNPVGIAAGFDKDARFIRELDYIGFGYIEVGTVTPLPQVGNPQPRLFRLKKDQALINRMGFNNNGVDAMVAKLKRLTERKIIIGGNIGKNKNTPLEIAHEDYLICFQKLYPYVDYFVVNVSSPNTPGLRSLQDKKPLLKILNTLIEARTKETDKKPILLKIAPDLTEGQIEDIIDILNTIDIEGVIATNTTIDRSNLNTHTTELDKIGNGGLSGAPVFINSTEILKTLRSKLNPIIAIIGVGGIRDPKSAKAKIDAGADLIQIYTGFIYEGPFLIKRIKKALA